MIKKIFKFAISLLPWFSASLLKFDYSYYDKIIKPFFAPPKIFYPIAWTIVYILIACTIYSVITSRKLKDIPREYIIIQLINFILNQSYTICFFGLKNTFLGFVTCLFTFITSLFLYEILKKFRSKVANLLIPYICLTLFASILSLSIYILNL